MTNSCDSALLKGKVPFPRAKTITPQFVLVISKELCYTYVRTRSNFFAKPIITRHVSI